ncbi:hypothetical protein Slin14017_G128590 [Septoria linicola]|nr:hypothetical protein Slin14017_G128590 [Septoria linicola]
MKTWNLTSLLQTITGSHRHEHARDGYTASTHRIKDYFDEEKIPSAYHIEAKDLLRLCAIAKISCDKKDIEDFFWWLAECEELPSSEDLGWIRTHPQNLTALISRTMSLWKSFDSASSRSSSPCSSLRSSSVSYSSSSLSELAFPERLMQLETENVLLKRDLAAQKKQMVLVQSNRFHRSLDAKANDLQKCNSTLQSQIMSFEAALQKKEEQIDAVAMRSRQVNRSLIELQKSHKNLQNQYKKSQNEVEALRERYEEAQAERLTLQGQLGRQLASIRKDNVEDSMNFVKRFGEFCKQQHFECKGINASEGVQGRKPMI